MPKCGKFGAASTAGWGAGAAIFSPVGRVVLRHRRPRGRVCVACPPSNKAIAGFPITHVACAWTLTVKAGEELREKARLFAFA
jgi:hypothetical protein